jgi:uncharacterized protein (TIGR02246 family)
MKTTLQFFSLLIALFAIPALVSAQGPPLNNNKVPMQKERAKVQADPDCVDRTRINTTDQCGRVYEPVCGCNGQTYASECEAKKNGVLSTVKGECAGSVHEEVRNFIATYEKAYNNADARTLSSLFAPDAVRTQPDGSQIQGNTVIGNQFSQSFRNAQLVTSIQILDVVSACPSSAYVSGTYTLNNKHSDGDPITGEYVSLCTKVDGKWQITRQNLYVTQ